MWNNIHHISVLYIRDNETSLFFWKTVWFTLWLLNTRSHSNDTPECLRSQTLPQLSHAPHILNNLGHLHWNVQEGSPCVWPPLLCLKLLAQCLAFEELLGERKEVRREGEKYWKKGGKMDGLKRGSQVVSMVASWSPLLLPWVVLTTQAHPILSYKTGRLLKLLKKKMWCHL